MNADELKALIARHLIEFYKRRLQKIQELKLKDILRRKNPYLFKAIGTHSATDLVEGILSAYLSSSEETIFGDAFFEPIAKFVSGGIVSPSEGVDIAIETNTTYKSISIKSGPNPFNSSQTKKQDDQFRTLMHRLQKLGKQFDPILGHAYGRTSPQQSTKVKRIYRRLAGQAFWKEVTGDPDFYLKLLRYMEEEIIIRHREEYQEAWQIAVNKHVREFTQEFCDESGRIDWEKLVRFNSAEVNPRK